MSSSDASSSASGSEDESSSEPEDESFLDDIEQARREDGVAHIRALKGGVIRAGIEMDSAKLGNLTPGEVFEVLGEGTTDDGTRRVRMERGWVSLTAKSG
eukprot:COSAG04_NODE_2538_length_3958_cov_13.961389_1_plen_99_part_10